ncbi:hypothetical protein UlMin_006950 [Ulmus minor]
MGSKVEACVACARICCLVHGKKNSSPPFNSFFKVMFGDKFNTILFLPDRFARKFSGLVGQKAFLEDSSGKQWEVKISNIHDSLAFNEGWSRFSSDHNLEIGDFVVFYHKMESQFFFNIYDTSGCLKSKRSILRKRMRDNRSSATRNGPYSINKTLAPSCSNVEKDRSIHEVNDMMKVPTISQNTSSWANRNSGPMCKTQDFEETCYMIGRDLGGKQGEDKLCNFDLSVFETPNNNSGIPQLSSSLRSQNETFQIGKNQVEKEVVSRAAVPSDFGLMEKNDNCGKVGKGVEIHDKNSKESGENISGMPGGTDKDSSVKEVSISAAVDCEMTEKINTIEEMDKNLSNFNPDSHIVIPSGSLLPLSAAIPEISGGNISNKSDSEMKEQLAEDPSKIPSSMSPSVQHGFTQYAQTEKCSKVKRIIKKETVETSSELSGEAKKIKKEPMETSTSTHTRDSKGKFSIVAKRVLNKSVSFSIREDHSLLPEGKTEIVDLVGTSIKSSDVSTWLATTTSDLSFIELPDCFPTPILKFPKSNNEMGLLLIQDEAQKLWPVVYHERSSLKVLSSGWEVYCSANSIRPGDQCRFTIKDKYQGIVSVRVVGK